MIIDLTMQFKKSTKNKHVYESMLHNPSIPTIYILKEAFTGARPDTIKVIVTTEED